MTRPLSYIGLSGLMSQAEVHAALAAFPDCGRLLMVGVLASAKTLAGLPNKWPLRYPRCEDIADIFIDDPRCLNLLHLSVDGFDGVIELVAEATRWAGPRCHGIQLNSPFPMTSATEAQVSDAGIELVTRRCGQDSRFVLQIRAEYINEHEINRRAAIARSLGATDVLIDFSGGAGRALNPAAAVAAVEFIRASSCGIDIGLGVAGGLCAETVPEVAHLIRSGCSIDVEGRIRDDADGGGNLDLGKTRAYLQAAAEVAR